MTAFTSAGDITLVVDVPVVASESFAKSADTSLLAEMTMPLPWI